MNEATIFLCTYCKAPAGAACKRPNGRATKPHAARVRRAAKADALGLYFGPAQATRANLHAGAGVVGA